MIVRVSLANARIRHVAASLQSAGINATLSKSIGVGDWGTEPGVTVEAAVHSADHRRLYEWAISWLQDHREQAAYVVQAGPEGTAAWLWWADGTAKIIG